MSPHPRDGRALLGHLGWGATHTPYSTVGSNCAAPFGCLTVVCTLSSAARGPLGGRNGALPYITAQQRPHIPGLAGHCLVTLGDHTHTTHAHHYRSHEQRLDTVFDGSNCAQFGWRTVVCTPSLAARPPKVTTQCPAISLGCRRGPWDVEDDVHTTVQHPNCKIRCRQR